MSQCMDWTDKWNFRNVYVDIDEIEQDNYAIRFPDSDIKSLKPNKFELKVIEFVDKVAREIFLWLGLPHIKITKDDVFILDKDEYRRVVERDMEISDILIPMLSFNMGICI